MANLTSNFIGIKSPNPFWLASAPALMTGPIGSDARALGGALLPLYANFARQRYDRIALDALFALAAEADLAGAMQRQLDGEIVNSTEGRAALHTALRGGLSLAAAGPHAQARRARERMQALVASLQASAVTGVVSVGIGGLAPANARLRVHFISNVDGNAARRVLAPLDPARTAAIVISKTFGTQETLLNGRIVRDWLGEGAAYHGGRLYAVSANVERAGDFGIPPERILPMWDWVGGRYSVWSAVGFPIARSAWRPSKRCWMARRRWTRTPTRPRCGKTWRCCTR